jgi:hypothetical protein
MYISVLVKTDTSYSGSATVPTISSILDFI